MFWMYRAAENVMMRRFALRGISLEGIVFENRDAALEFATLIMNEYAALTPDVTTVFKHIADPLDRAQACECVEVTEDDQEGVHRVARWSGPPTTRHNEECDEECDEVIFTRPTEVRLERNKTCLETVEVNGHKYSRNFEKTLSSPWYVGAVETLTMRIIEEDHLEIK
jgi:hypothetical protein